MTNGRKWVTAEKEVFSFFSAYRRTVEWARRASPVYLCISDWPVPAVWTDWLNSLFGTCIIETLRPQTTAISSLLVLFSLLKHISQHYHTEYLHLNSAVLSTSFWRVIKDAPLKNQLLQITILKNQETEQCANESAGPHHKCRSRIKHSSNAMIHSWCKIPAEHPAELYPLERNNIQKTKLWS